MYVLALERSKQMRWAKDRAYEEYTQADTCCRTFFENVREPRVYSHIEKLIGPSGHTFTSMRSMLKEARRLVAS